MRGSTLQSHLCNHANEVPTGACTCPANCYCRQHTCVWRWEEPVTPVLKTENDIERALNMIEALTRNLLSLPVEQDVLVHIRPKRRLSYEVSVEVDGFVLQKTSERMFAALEAVLAELSTRVHARMEEAARLLDSSSSAPR